MKAQIESLKKLNKVQSELKAKTIDKILTDNNFFERTSELFKPLIQSNEKQTEDTKDINKILKILEEILPISTKNMIENISSLKPKQTNTGETGGNSWFKELENGEFYLANAKNKTHIYCQR